MVSPPIFFLLNSGLPYPENEKIAFELEGIVRESGAIPATIAILDGYIKVGLSGDEVKQLADPCTTVSKVSRRDISYILATKAIGATTVAATSLIAARCGIHVFATGGIGGVHRNGEDSMDISADLTELGRTPIAVCSAGVKSILDIGRTLEYLETQGVSVVTYGSNEFPSFFTAKSGFKSPLRLDDPLACARLIDNNLKLNLGSGVLIAIPIPEQYSAEGTLVENAIKQAIDETVEKNITGRDWTPYVLKRVAVLTEGKSLKANVELIKNNTHVASLIAVELANIRNTEGKYDNRPVIIGMSAVDIIAESNHLIPRESNIGRIKITPGGVGRNIAEALGRLNDNPILISVLGNDTFSEYILDHAKDYMETCYIKRIDEGNTPVYNALLSKKDMATAVNDMGLIEQLNVQTVMKYESLISNASFLVVDANIPVSTLEYVCEIAHQNNVDVWFEPTSAVKSVKCVSLIDKLTYISPNIYELQAISKALGGNDSSLPTDHMKVLFNRNPDLKIFLTLGEEGVLFANNVSYTLLEPYNPEKMVNTTGAGDSFTAGVIHSLLQGKDVLYSVEVGLIAAKTSLESEYPIDPYISTNLLRK
eukprot:TRINITY_DN1297_c0_g2_i5.p1 TRINITY_DN1297_c0_g2~~TRINITY_DN1297_c0_g2_i5.p1  ORF type:complete len:595 (-),score=125.63 TRINITY_DN1297_c0_g2_i5:1215-2999(-)